MQPIFAPPFPLSERLGASAQNLPPRPPLPVQRLQMEGLEAQGTDLQQTQNHEKPFIVCHRFHHCTSVRLLHQDPVPIKNQETGSQSLSTTMNIRKNTFPHLHEPHPPLFLARKR
jgi:hypothetical protein